MKKSLEEIRKEIMEELKKANPNVKIEVSPVPVKSNKPDSFSENMKSQEQADFFRKMLKMLQEEEKNK